MFSVLDLGHVKAWGIWSCAWWLETFELFPGVKS